MNQVGIPVDVRPEEVLREKTLGDSLALCIKAAGHHPKEVMAEIKVNGKPMDKAQWSRWESGQEGIIWPKLVAVMDFCGNDAPLLWMAAQRRFDLHSLRKIETETQRENRQLREENLALRRVLLAGGAA